ncbi:MAG: hypothetical protein Q9198_000337 [Flavoplaca austrocitrina]
MRRFWELARARLPFRKWEGIKQVGAVRILDGDIEKPRLGLSEEDILEVQTTTTIYIHCACSVNLQRSLSSISKSVIEPSLVIADLALASPNLDSFVYVSTAYANAHLHYTHHDIDTKVLEQVYPLRPSSGDSTDLEYSDLCTTHYTSTPEFQFHNFPFPYAYAKHLCERLLLHRFASHTTGHEAPIARLLILRPSILGPAIREPYPYYEVPGSVPATSVLAALITSPSLRMHFSSRFPDPMTQSTLDEVPVDIVVNQLMMHLSHQSAGIVHAVAGARGRRSIESVWANAMSERNLPWCPRLIWHKDVDWHDQRLHPLCRAFKIMGTNFIFDNTKNEQVWDWMTPWQRDNYPLWMDNLEQNGDVKSRRVAYREQISRYFKKRNVPMLLLDLLVKRPVGAVSWQMDVLQHIWSVVVAVKSHTESFLSKPASCEIEVK